jgi:hypothetical protein
LPPPDTLGMSIQPLSVARKGRRMRHIRMGAISHPIVNVTLQCAVQNSFELWIFA